MKNLCELTLQEFENLSYELDSGEKLECKTKHIIFEKGGINKLTEILTEISPYGKFMIVSSFDVYAKFGNVIENILKTAQFDVFSYIFENNILPSMKLCGELLNAPENIRAVIVIGGGSVHNVVSYFCSLESLPLISIPSAPSSDEFLSFESTLYVAGTKENFATDEPYAIICDEDIFLSAPRNMVAAGYGLMISKIVSLIDYKLSACLNKTKYCDDVYSLLKKAIEKAQSAGKNLASNDGKILLMQSLIYSSLATVLSHNNFNELSGAGQTAQYLELKRKRNNMPKLLYGENLFLSFLRVLKMYKLFYMNDSAKLIQPINYLKRLESLKTELSIREKDVIVLYNLFKKESIETKIEVAMEIKENMLIDIFKALDNETEYRQVFSAINGNSLDNFYSESEYFSALMLSTDISKRYTTLTLIRDAGLLQF